MPVGAENNKAQILDSLIVQYKGKLSEEDKAKILGKLTGKMLSRLTAQLIKTSGYGVALTILRRELEEIGKENAGDIMKIFNFSGDKQMVASQILKIAALLLGLNLKVVDNETVVTDCPLCKLAVEQKEQTLTKICLDYCAGVVAGVLGDSYQITEDKCLAHGDPYCSYSIRKR